LAVCLEIFVKQGSIKKYFCNMTQRFYFDTSVFGGMFDTEFEEETTLLFEKVKLGQIVCVYSNLTESELANAPHKVQQFFESISQEHTQTVNVTPAALALAQTYIDEKVVGQTSLDDCIHIAVATLSKVDILVSWNFKHIVNVYRIRGYNSVNLRLGYSTLEIRSPKEIVGNEDER
jgi:predicted nucleic acid-binding protein